MLSPARAPGAEGAPGEALGDATGERPAEEREPAPALDAARPGVQREAGGAVERLVRCPSRLLIRLITASGWSESTLSRHLPAPSPSAPSSPSPSPDSSAGAHSLRDAPAGMRVATAPVAIARLAEQINVLALKATVIDVVSSVAKRYRDYMQAERRVDIRTRSLERARALREVNELLVRTGRMAERKLARGTSVEQGEGLLTLGDLDGFTVAGRVDEVDVARIRPGHRATVTGDAFPGVALRGT